MIIKKLVVGSLFSMLLVSKMAAADWGDVYYCQMTNFIRFTLEGEVKNYKLEKFQFKLDQTKNAMVMGSTGYFKDEVFELVTPGVNVPSQEYWYATDREYQISPIIIFKKGKLVHAQDALGVSVISADCDKF